MVLVFRDTFESDTGWNLNEELVTPCHASGIGEAVRSTDSKMLGGWGFSVRANKAMEKRSNHVIGGKPIQGEPNFPGHRGIFSMKVHARMDPNGNDGQTGPEFSMQNTRPLPSGVLTATAGLQYLPYAAAGDSWMLWVEGAWKDLELGLKLTPNKWYDLTLTADYNANRYVQLVVKEFGAASDLINISLTDHRIADEAKGFGQAFVVTLEAENLSTKCTEAKQFRVSYDEVAVRVNADSVPKPFHRRVNTSDGNHFWTTDPSEATSPPWEDEQVACKVFVTQVEGTVPLYRRIKTDNGDHFWTTNPNEAVDPPWEAEQIACFVYPTQVAETVPLYRRRNSNNGQHFFTIDPNEATGGPWEDEGVACFVLHF